MDILHMDVAEQKLSDKLINRSDHAPFSASLRNNTILLISPQPWDHIAISKHHENYHTIHFLCYLKYLAASAPIPELAPVTTIFLPTKDTPSFSITSSPVDLGPSD